MIGVPTSGLGNLFGPGGLGDLGVPQAADVNSLLNNVGAIKNNTGKIAKRLIFQMSSSR